jgi:hypothetical protein
MPAASMGSLVVDIRPWARVRIVSADPNVPAPAETRYAPFAIDLPPGDYTLECENDGVNRAAKFAVKVIEGKPQYVTRSMPGFNATKIVDAILSQQN